jgi:hypothetical protein
MCLAELLVRGLGLSGGPFRQRYFVLLFFYSWAAEGEGAVQA